MRFAITVIEGSGGRKKAREVRDFVRHCKAGEQVHIIYAIRKESQKSRDNGEGAVESYCVIWPHICVVMSYYLRGDSVSNPGANSRSSCTSLRSFL